QVRAHPCGQYRPFGSMPDRVRAFVALGVPAAQRDALGRYLRECARLAPDYRWVAAEGLHLTLRFLGSVEPSRLEAELAKVRAAPFRLALGEPDAFGGRASPRVVWLSL